jgi:hypothetical protein
LVEGFSKDQTIQKVELEAKITNANLRLHLPKVGSLPDLTENVYQIAYTENGVTYTQACFTNYLSDTTSTLYVNRHVFGVGSSEQYYDSRATLFKSKNKNPRIVLTRFHDKSVAFNVAVSFATQPVTGDQLWTFEVPLASKNIEFHKNTLKNTIAWMYAPIWNKKHPWMWCMCVGGGFVSNTRAGDCGSPLFVEENGSLVLVGLHNATVAATDSFYNINSVVDIVTFRSFDGANDVERKPNLNGYTGFRDSVLTYLAIFRKICCRVYL